MSNNPCAPMCACGQDSVYIDNGPRLQYYYCRSCKVEVGLQEVAAPASYSGPGSVVWEQGATLKKRSGFSGGVTITTSPKTDYRVVAIDHHLREIHILEHPQPLGPAWAVGFHMWSGPCLPNVNDILNGYNFPRPTLVPQPSGSYTAPAATVATHSFYFSSYRALSATCKYCGVDEIAVAGGYASNACGGQQQAAVSQQPAPLSKASPLAVDHMMDAYRYWAASIKEKEWD